MLIRIFILSALLILLVVATEASGSSPEDQPCSKHPKLVGKCFMVHGKLSVYNGAPALRIWKIGTKRMLGVSEQRFALPGYSNVPEDVRSQIDQDKALFGDYLVCPFTRSKPNEMQMVCIEKVKNLVVKKL
jgi:hypothetical protein